MRLRTQRARDPGRGHRAAGRAAIVVAALLAATVTGCDLDSGEDGYPSAIPGTGAVLAEDLAREPDATVVWGNVNPDPDDLAGEPVETLTSDGDPHRLVDGSSNGSFRRITISDGDRADGDPLTRERLHVGAKSLARGADYPGFYPFGEGGAEGSVILYLSFRLQPQSPDFPAQTGAGSKTQIWQLIHDAPCAQPPRVAMDERAGNEVALTLSEGDEGGETVLWSEPVARDVWHRVAVRMQLSDDPDEGSIELFGDVGPGGGMYPLMDGPITTNTLRGDECLLDGVPRASLFIGRYQDSSVGASYVDIANVQLTRWER
ncbi:hypothetical protein HJD18_06840 [Thermoleophilia bacterium SCSIO 60948]|nr:hypothetical protein HJD18_06840 [Thermoleophilia bacterium SCSIO 60948]